MRLSFKQNVTCRPTWNLWFVNVFSTFRHQNSVVKNWQLVGPPGAAGPPPMVQPAQWLIRHCNNIPCTTSSTRPVNKIWRRIAVNPRSGRRRTQLRWNHTSKALTKWQHCTVRSSNITIRLILSLRCVYITSDLSVRGLFVTLSRGFVPFRKLPWRAYDFRQWIPSIYKHAAIEDKNVLI